MSSVFNLTDYRGFQDAVNIIGDFEETVLYGDLDWQLKRTTCEDRERGVKMIPRNREQIAARHHWTVKTAKKKFQSLVNRGLFNSRIGMWYKKKSFFISKGSDIDVWLDYEKLDLLTSHTGSHQASMMLAFFAFCLNSSFYSVDDNGKRHVFVRRSKLSSLLQCCPKTVDNYAKALKDRGIIDYDMRNHRRGRNFYLTINQEFYDKACAEWEAKREGFIEQKIAKQEKITPSIRITNSSEDLKNNTTASSMTFPKDLPLSAQSSGITLSRKKQRYLRGALTRTLDQIPDNPYNMQALFNQVFYAITNPSFLKTTQSFNHAVNRFMFLIRNKLWRPPFGYNKYDSNGKKEWQEILAREEANKAQKSDAELARTNTQGVSKMQKKMFKSPLGFEVEHEVEEPTYNFQQKSSSMFVKEYDVSYEYQETAVQKACREAIERDIAQKKSQGEMA